MKKILLAATFFAAVTSLTSCVKHEVPNRYAYSFDDEFNDNFHNWSFDDNVNNAHVSISGGLLQYNYFPANNGTNTVAITTGANLAGDFDIQTRLSTDNAMALVFGVSPGDYGYTFFINSQGQFAVYDEGNATVPVTTLLNWTSSSAIVSGWNNIEMEQYNGTWTGYINGTQVFSIPAHTLYGEQIGFEELANTHGTADYLQVQW